MQTRNMIRTAVCAVATMAMLTGGSVLPALAADEATYIISVPDGQVSPLVTDLAQLGETPDHVYTRAIDGVAVSLSAAEVSMIQSENPEAQIVPDSIVTMTATRSGATWGLSALDQSTAPADTSYTYPDSAGTGVDVFVIDTGVENRPADFGGTLDTARARDFTGLGTWVDCNGHGTHVAGIIAAQSDSVGVTGIAPNVKIQPIRALGVDGGNSSDLIAALRWAAGLPVPGVSANPTPAKVVNLSMGTDSYTPCRLRGQDLGATEVALADLKAAGVTVISAAGNFDVPASESYPGNCYPTINVGATAFSGDRASYSNYSVPDSKGQMVGVDISAPGGDSKFPGDSPAESKGKIVSTWNDGKTIPGSPTYWGEEGTSMAAPVVTGVVALIYSIKPNITFDDVWKVVSETATKFPPGSTCETKNICGIGIVNAGAAVAAAAALP